MHSEEQSHPINIAQQGSGAFCGGNLLQFGFLQYLYNRASTSDLTVSLWHSLKLTLDYHLSFHGLIASLFPRSGTRRSCESIDITIHQQINRTQWVIKAIIQIKKPQAITVLAQHSVRAPLNLMKQDFSIVRSTWNIQPHITHTSDFHGSHEPFFNTMLSMSKDEHFVPEQRKAEEGKVAKLKNILKAKKEEKKK